MARQFLFAFCALFVATPALAGDGEASITLNTASMSGMTGKASVSWEFPSHLDESGCFVGVFSPPQPNVTNLGFIDYPWSGPFTATAPAAFIACDDVEGSSFDIEVLNMRDDYVFYLFGGGINNSFPLANSSVLTWQDVNRPMHVHLMRTQDPTEMKVQWTSKWYHDDDRVQYGFSSGEYKYEVAANHSTYSHYELCGEPAATVGWREPGFFMTAVMDQLPADGETRVFYRVGSSDDGWSKEFSFVTALKPGANSTLKFIAIADMGVTFGPKEQYHWEEPDAWQTMKWAGQWVEKDHHLLIHIGDVSYATGYAAKWEAFMNAIEPVAASLPYMVSEGNHERDYPKSGSFYPVLDSGGECGVPTQSRFPMPLDKDTTEKEYWYSFEQGPVHFIMASSEVDIVYGSKQYRWLEADLKSIDRDVTPWVIFTFHRPIYFGNQRDPVLRVVEPLLNEHKVDLGLAGHVHNAQLWCPQYKSKCVTAPAGEWGAMQYAVIGNAGNQLTPFTEDLDERTIFALEAYGYSRLEVNATVLTMEFYANTNNELKYTLEIERNYPRRG